MAIVTAVFSFCKAHRASGQEAGGYSLGEVRFQESQYHLVGC
jgi:hypothetical protein